VITISLFLGYFESDFGLSVAGVSGIVGLVGENGHRQHRVRFSLGFGRG
jgi:hypothetical protein